MTTVTVSNNNGDKIYREVVPASCAGRPPTLPSQSSYCQQISAPHVLLAVTQTSRQSNMQHTQHLMAPQSATESKSHSRNKFFVVTQLLLALTITQPWFLRYWHRNIWQQKDSTQVCPNLSDGNFADEIEVIVGGSSNVGLQTFNIEHFSDNKTFATISVSAQQDNRRYTL